MDPVKGGRSAPDFLNWFRDHGFFLDDLVHKPINWRIRAERRSAHYENVGDVVDRILEYSLKAIVIVLKFIKSAVGEALDRSAIHVPHYVVSFPENGKQRHFLEEMAEIIPKLPRI
jgi:hypothetical protein